MGSSGRLGQEQNLSKHRVYRLYREIRGREVYVGVWLTRTVVYDLWIRRRRLEVLASRVLRDFRHL